ncbi:uncharacterized protein [Miscanthus floridulus]|uniref:uncharacterized protein n=1 Tax=Miscanthus floridulus TaxID=154761 RepID=UPI003459C161
MADLNEEVGGTNGHDVWTAPEIAFMLTHLANLVASGTKTCSGFKKVHLNTCAKAINEKFRTMKTGEQVKNHLKTQQRKFAKMTKLRKVSATGWGEDNFIITLDEEHYNDYVKDHKADAEFLNRRLPNYGEMRTIFGNSMATGKFAKDSNSALGTEEANTENEDLNANTVSELNANGESEATPSPSNQAATSSASKPKKARIGGDEEDGLIVVINRVGDRLAEAIEKACVAPPPQPTNDLPDDLFNMLINLPGFDATQLNLYYQYLVANKDMGRAFYNRPFDHKLMWVAMFVFERFPGQ